MCPTINPKSECNQLLKRRPRYRGPLSPPLYAARTSLWCVCVCVPVSTWTSLLQTLRRSKEERVNAPWLSLWRIRGAYVFQLHIPFDPCIGRHVARFWCIAARSSRQFLQPFLKILRFQKSHRSEQPFVRWREHKCFVSG